MKKDVKIAGLGGGFDFQRKVVNNAARVGGASVVVGQRSVDGIVQLLLVEQLFNGGFVVEVSLGRARAPARAKFTHAVQITAAAVGLVKSPSPAVRKQYRLYAVVKTLVVLQKSTFCLTSDVLWLKLADQLSSISLFHGSVG
ncbi:hypothetical protein T08_5687 [Trichinella sp. T8]|nr:hypothetical protein T08_5687 [Trichinella sp. T8]